MMETTRAEHMKWCKKRALQYAEAGDLQNAVASMGSDLTKHEDTNNSANMMLVLYATSLARNNDRHGVIKWINGFAE